MARWVSKFGWLSLAYSSPLVLTRLSSVLSNYHGSRATRWLGFSFRALADRSKLIWFARAAMVRFRWLFYFTVTASLEEERDKFRPQRVLSPRKVASLVLLFRYPV